MHIAHTLLATTFIAAAASRHFSGLTVSPSAATALTDHYIAHIDPIIVKHKSHPPRLYRIRLLYDARQHMVTTISAQHALESTK